MLDTLLVAEAPEGIALQLRPAGLSARVLAYGVDLLIRLVLFFVLIVLLGRLGGFAQMLLMVSMFLLEWFYPVLFELLPGSATPGKRLLGLRVTMDNGLPVSFGASLLRNLLRAADFLPFGYALGLLSLLLRRDFKRLGDLAAGTLVVHQGRTLPPGRQAEAAPAAPTRALDRREQAVILAWAGRAPRLTPERADELAALASPAWGGTPTDAEPARRLQGIAAWLMGRR
jgi:uncharacterized RDD family membrane protein YckC